jgi:DNA-binding MarR family transcriptional regulator
MLKTCDAKMARRRCGDVMTHDLLDERIERMIQLMDAVARQMRPDLTEQWPDVELTMPQLRTLILLSNGPLRMSDVADQIGSSYSATTAMIDRLVEKELVDREHGKVDRRVVTCKLTERGISVLDAFWRIQNDRMRELASVLTGEQIDTIIESMEILLDAQQRVLEASLPSSPS